MINDLIVSINPNGDNLLNFSEFINLICREYSNTNRDNEIKYIFEIIDKDKDGLLSRSDIQNVFKLNI